MYVFTWHRVRASDIEDLKAEANTLANYGTEGDIGTNDQEWGAAEGVDFNATYSVKEVRVDEHGDTTATITSILWIPSSSGFVGADDEAHLVNG